ncbi:MAG: aspartate kinase [Planctomycetota bacterium]
MSGVRVLKFGGTALRDGPAVRRAAEVVRRHGGEAPLVVVSAHAGVTQLLGRTAEAAAAGDLDAGALRVRHRSLLRQLDLPPELLDRHLAQLQTVLRAVQAEGHLDRRRRDFVLSFGERMSARVVAAGLRQAGVPATPVDAFDLGLLSETRSGLTVPLEGARERVREAVLAVPGVPVVTGFIALDAEGHVTTLGRSGSDLSAVWIGEAVGAEEVHLWKTVDGVFSADPSVVPSARRLERLDPRIAAELALHGAEVLHPAALEPARRGGIPILVRSVAEGASPGTCIAEGDAGKAYALAHRRAVALVTHRVDLGRDPGEQMTRLHAACREAGLDPFLFAVPGAEAVLLLPDPEPGTSTALERVVGEGRVERGLASFALVGPALGDDPAVVAEVVELCRGAGLTARSLPAGDGPLSRLFLTPSKELSSALRLVHDAFALRGGRDPGSIRRRRSG